MEDRLYKFAGLIDAGSFTKAAQQLHISQPALTTAIKKLERELHAELLIRNSHTFKMTAAGAIAYETAKSLSVQAHNLRLRLAEAAKETVPLHIGAIDSIAEMLIIRGNKLADLGKTTNLSLTVDNSRQLVTFVSHDTLDIALVAQPQQLPPSLISIDLGSEPLILVTAASRADEVRQALERGVLPSFLSYNVQSHTSQLIDLHMKTHGVTVKPVFHSTSPEIILQAALQGRGHAVLPLPLVKDHLKRGTLVSLHAKKIPLIKRPVVSVHRAGKSLPDQVTRLLADTKQELLQLNTQAKQL